MEKLITIVTNNITLYPKLIKRIVTFKRIHIENIYMFYRDSILNECLMETLLQRNYFH